MSRPQQSPTIRPGRVYAGVVIELPEPVGRELQDWRASFGDPASYAVPAHITLMIAPQDASWDDVVERVRTVAREWAPFRVEIDGTGTFRPVTPVVYLRIAEGAEQCRALHEALHGERLVSASPFAFHPHVTIAQAVEEEDLDRAQQMLRTYRAGFLVDRIGLYELDADGTWRTREEIPFANGGRGRA
ncbi:2'-5' RNA ligase family protein [Kocuria sp. LUK]|uniref:2'-5' RNA ligase n=1 Tax=Kocuria flava TaxID=446860 RepID=A0A2N4T521_9MICC|nr:MULTISPECIES: 2'-5' RNA ligase family protein [Kocuria]MCD1144832.1 2'-5' RNA ligase family protein [Kocuria sp. LUK]PLC13324.1 2'-5' RNA ligase [Kocuria flava]